MFGLGDKWDLFTRKMVLISYSTIAVDNELSRGKCRCQKVSKVGDAWLSFGERVRMSQKETLVKHTPGRGNC